MKRITHKIYFGHSSTYTYTYTYIWVYHMNRWGWKRIVMEQVWFIRNDSICNRSFHIKGDVGPTYHAWFSWHRLSENWKVNILIWFSCTFFLFYKISKILNYVIFHPIKHTAGFSRQCCCNSPTGNTFTHMRIHIAAALQKKLCGSLWKYAWVAHSTIFPMES